MAVQENKNNFASHQSDIIEVNTKNIEAELKGIRGRAGVKFSDIDALVRYVSKVTGIHRTTLKRNTAYRILLRDFLARQHGAMSLVKMDDASPELLHAMIEDRDMKIGNLHNQTRILNAKINSMELEHSKLPVQAVATTNIEASVDKTVAPANSESAFQDTAFALLQLIKHINSSANSESIVIDEDENLILDMAVVNPKKRREMAIGPERTKPFIKWFKVNKHLL